MIVLTLALLISSACVRTKEVLVDPAAPKLPEVDPGTIRIITDESELEGLDFVRVAMIEATASSGWTDQSKMIEAMRKKAGKVGANAILMPTINEAGAGAKVAGALFGTGTQRKGNVIAIFIRGPKEE